MRLRPSKCMEWLCNITACCAVGMNIKFRQQILFSVKPSLNSFCIIWSKSISNPYWIKSNTPHSLRNWHNKPLTTRRLVDRKENIDWRERREITYHDYIRWWVSTTICIIQLYLFYFDWFWRVFSVWLPT